MQRRGVPASKHQTDDYVDNTAPTSAPPHRNVLLRHHAVVADTAAANTSSSSSPPSTTRKKNDRRPDFQLYRLSGGKTTTCRCDNRERCSPFACLIWIAFVFTAVITLLWTALWIHIPESTTLLPLLNRRPHSPLFRSTSTTLLVPASKPTLPFDTTSSKLPSAAMATVTAAAAPRLKRHVDAATAAPVKTDDNVLDLGQLVDELPFDNEDGGVWKQGWDVQPISNTSKLRIVVVPFSNCEPGRTLSLDYDYIEARKVIDTIVNSLLNDKRRTFIWSEINLLAQWWQHQDDDMRRDVRELLRNGQLELVSGGWTTPDEAVTTLYALEQQLQLGHDWIRTNLGAEHLPRTAWSVPTLSGHSPTLAHLYQKYNVTTGLVLHRVHYAVKKKLAQSRQLEFYWRISSGRGRRQQQQQHQKQQLQQHMNPQNDLWTHIMPFYTYDIPHTCGPNPETCCRFDFGRSSVGPCPWPSQPVLVNDDNVAEQAHVLLDQYRRKAALYRSHTLLIPLGGDYRYGTPDEAELQLLQYQRLFDYMNQNVTGVHIEFGTLSRYFTLAKQSFEGPVPIVKGSFFPYADVDANYWTGLFTSQASDKLWNRQLERIMQAAESLGAAATSLQLPTARRTLALVQDRNVITGVIHEAAMNEYGKRVHQAILDVEDWILVNSSLPRQLEGLVSASDVKDFRLCSHSSFPRRHRMYLCNDTQTVVAFNPSAIDQSCGNILVPSGRVAIVKPPCSVPGPTKTSRTKFVFDSTTGLLLEPIREEWLVWKDLDEGSATLFTPGEQESYNLTAHEHRVSNGGFTVQTEFWKRTITERFVSESSTATVLDFHYDVHVKAVDQEWLVRFSTNITNSGYLHTDLNGFHYDTHRYRKDMPIQSQIFPMSTLASIQDRQRRFSVLSDHSKGVASLQEGAIDVWLDRGLKRDGSLSGNGVPALRSLTQLRLVLERGAYDLDGDFEATRFCRQMVQEVQAPLILFGKRRSLSSPYLLNAQKQFTSNTAHVDRIKQEAQAKAPDRVSMDVVRNVTSTVHAVDTATIPFVFMVYKRDGYLKSAMEALMRSDFPRDRVLIIISHDGRVPAMIKYVESLKKDFNVIQLFHPHACYDHPDTFPGNDPKLNEIYEGDVNGSPRLFEVTCCKHHFTWLMATVFTNTNFTRENVNTFLFLEEDYVVSPVIYQGLVNGLNAMDQFADETNGGFLGLSLDPSADRYIQQLGEDLGPGEWFASAFKSGPMTMHRSTFALLQRGGGGAGAYYCGLDGFDEYNWDWSLVHVQSQFLIPHTVLAPSKVLAEHIGVEGGMHNHIRRDNSASAATSFLGLTVRGSVWQDPRLFLTGFGGWGHPADQEHCMRLLSSSGTVNDS